MILISSSQYSRFIIKYNINSLSTEIVSRFNNTYSFYSGQAFAFFENNKQYFFILKSTESSRVGLIEISRIDNGGVGARWDDSSI